MASTKKQQAPYSHKPTLLDVLTRPNPLIIDHWDGVSYSNTESRGNNFDVVKFEPRFPQTCQPWTDFNFDAIRLAYGDILDQSVQSYQDAVPDIRAEAQEPSATPCEVSVENDLDTLGILWSCNIVRGPIKAAASQLQQRFNNSNGTPPNPTLASKKIGFKKPGAKAVTFNPDWAILDRALDKVYPEDGDKDRPEKPIVYVVGDSKLKQKWKSEYLNSAGDLSVPADAPFRKQPRQAMVEVTEERLKPLQQMAAYCRYAQTRYAYIITQTELVALRVRRVHKEKKDRRLGLRLAASESAEERADQPRAAVEWKAVPWDSGAPDGLTVNLAIWALGCMALNDQERQMELPMREGERRPLESMAKLTWWKMDKDGAEYENVISRRRIPANQWKLEWAKFVHIDKDGSSGGNSNTSDFDPWSRGSSSGPSGAGSSLMAKMKGLNIGSPSRKG